ncbi:hypothetical protein TNCV_4138541 [Trichonephila clavipes]|nr:hypothetical protein TNCV_4138541 [Trichonephila clavipes]
MFFTGGYVTRETRRDNTRTTQNLFATGFYMTVSARIVEDGRDNPATLRTELHLERLVHVPKIPKSAMKEHSRPKLRHHALVQFQPGLQDPWLMSLKPYSLLSVGVKKSELRLITPCYSFPVLYTPVSVLSCPGKTCNPMVSIEQWYSRRLTAPKPIRGSERFTVHLLTARLAPSFNWVVI